MTINLEHLSQRDLERIARRAERNVASEATLIWGAGGAFIAVALFVLGPFLFFGIADWLAIRPTAVWIGLSFALSSSWAITHLVIAKKTVQKAIDLQIEINVAREAANRREVAGKMDALNKNGQFERVLT